MTFDILFGLFGAHLIDLVFNLISDVADFLIMFVSMIACIKRYW